MEPLNTVHLSEETAHCPFLCNWMLLLWWESWGYVSRCCFYMTESGCLAFIQSCCFCFQHQTLLPSVCDMGPVVVIKHLLYAYKNPAAGAFYHIAQPAIKSDLPLRSEGKKRANGEPFWAPGPVFLAVSASARVCVRADFRHDLLTYSPH